MPEVQRDGGLGPAESGRPPKGERKKGQPNEERSRSAGQQPEDQAAAKSAGGQAPREGRGKKGQPREAGREGGREGRQPRGEQAEAAAQPAERSEGGREAKGRPAAAEGRPQGQQKGGQPRDTGRGDGQKPRDAGRGRKPEAPEEPPKPKVKTTPRLLERYRKEVVPALVKEFNYTNPMMVPRLRKVALNIGFGKEAQSNAKALESSTRDLTIIAGQKPVVTQAKKSIANFKLREGQQVGAMVTLRGSRMYFFLDRFFNASLPRIRDFRGVSRTSFDGRGNYTLGLRDQMLFPDLEYGQIDKMRGMQITISTSARSNQEALRLLELLGMPFTRVSAA